MLRELTVGFLLIIILMMAIPLYSNYYQTEKAFTSNNFLVKQSIVSEYK